MIHVVDAALLVSLVVKVVVLLSSGGFLLGLVMLCLL